ncbi:Dabb family protein [Sporobolomyces salmoneus]|uniref:Dabb family protein n=1 Tax=Sporobolomyces salmoneus TaxID=183962 RepID=UPI00318242B1
MTIIHVVLTKLNGQQPANWKEDISSTGQAMVGKIPGLLRCEVGPLLESTKWRAQGWDQMLFAELESEEALKLYADHEVHVEYKNKTQPFITEVMAFDLVV